MDWTTDKRSRTSEGDVELLVVAAAEIAEQLHTAAPSNINITNTARKHNAGGQSRSDLIASWQARVLPRRERLRGLVNCSHTRVLPWSSRRWRSASGTCSRASAGSARPGWGSPATNQQFNKLRSRQTANRAKCRGTHSPPEWYGAASRVVPKG